MTRAEALAAAREIVEDLAPRTNARGYADGVIKPGERVALVLQVADWLLSGGETSDPLPAEVVRTCHECGRSAGDIVHIAGDTWMHAYGNCDTDGHL